MKTRVFTDDGLPESWDYNDNYRELDQVEARVHVLKWEGDAAPASTSVTKIPHGNAGERTLNTARARRLGKRILKLGKGRQPNGDFKL